LAVEVARAVASTSNDTPSDAAAVEKHSPLQKQPRKRFSKFPAAVQERIDTLKARVKSDKHDAEAWELLIWEVKSRQQSTEISEILHELYSEMVEVFPTSAATWRGFIEFEMKLGNTADVKSMFSKCLLKCKNLDLWRTYIKYVKRLNDVSTPEGANEVKQAYEFTLDHLGTDISSGPLWLEYIQFLQQTSAHVLFAQAVAGNEESAKLMSIRRAFKRSVTIPTHSLEALWRDYEKFENNINKQLAKQIISDLQSQYALARTIYREVKKKWEGLKTTALAVPPRGSSVQYEQQSLWTKLISFERSNPLKLEGDALVSRVALVYDQCLLCLHHYPEIWYEYIVWHADSGRTDRASEIFQEACKSLPLCVIIHFAAADFEAAQGNTDAAKKIYEALLEKGSDVGDAGIQGQIWIQYMRFLRRTEGAPASRKLFLRARKSESCSHHIYSTAALLEWQNGKDVKVVKNIFELGLKSFMKEADYVLEYVKFLLSQADIANARTLFERALTVVQGGNAKVVWNEYLEFEYQCGDLQSTLALEKRRSEAMRKLNEEENSVGDGGSTFNIGILLLRYHVPNLMPCSQGTLQHFQTIGLDEVPYLYPNEMPAALALSDDQMSAYASYAEPVATGSRPAAQQAPAMSGAAASSLPPAVAGMLKKLPLRHQLKRQLPTIQDVDYVINVLVNADIKALRHGGKNSKKRGLGDVEHKSNKSHRPGSSTNMKPGLEHGFNMPPKHDVYRMRQQQQRQNR